jgi:single-strand DNA-binding protein
MNNITIIGNTCHKPDVKELSNGSIITTISVAVSSTRKDQNGKYLTDFFTVKTYGKIADFVAKYVEKGNKVAINGSLHIVNYETKAGEKRTTVEIDANNVDLLTPKDVKVEPRNDDDQEEEPVEEADSDLPF